MIRQIHEDANTHVDESPTLRRRGLIAGAAALATAFLAARSAQSVTATDGDSLTLGHDSQSDLNNHAERTTFVVTDGSPPNAFANNVFFQFDASYVNFTPLSQNQQIDAIRAIGAGNRPGIVGMVQGTNVGIPSYAAIFGTGINTGSSGTLPSGAIGVYGTTSNNAGVRGISTNHIGVWGTGTGDVGVRGDSANSYGVYGVSTNDTGVVGAGGAGGGAGVKGFGGHGSGTGVIGFADGASDPGPAQGSAIYGRGAGTSHIGVRGDSDSGNGVQGTSVSAAGVLGVSTSSRGVYGQIPASSAPGTVAVYGENLATGSGGAGVWGVADAASANTGIGVKGQAAGGTGVYGVIPGGSAANTIGIYGSNGSSAPDSHGIVGLTNAGHGLVGTSNAHPHNGFPYAGLVGLAGVSDANAGNFYGNVAISGHLSINGNQIASGTKSAAIAQPDGTHTLVYCVESPESWLEDFGTGTLAGGVADVKIDPAFAAIADTKAMHVFFTETGDHHGLHLAGTSAAGFTVRADAALLAAKGKKVAEASGTFSYRVVARRKDVKAERLATFTFPKIQRPDLSHLPKP